MASFQLRRLRPHDRLEANGVTLLAVFDMDMGPVVLGGCALLRMADGTLKASPPRSGRGRGIGATFADDRVAARVLKAALTAYRAAGYEIESE